ncbi:MAG: hypothetical protein Q9195_008655 [Heterodermia aff. obscurata]
MNSFKYRYTPAPHEHEECETPSPEKTVTDIVEIRYRIGVCALVLAGLVGALALWLVQYTFQYQKFSSENWTLEQMLGFHSNKQTLRTFAYNRTFASAPSKETDEAWNALFPTEGMGFIADQRGQLEAVGVSIFHQLHCLNLLRHLYYAAEVEPALAAKSKESEKHSRRHARHCFDYLRQALICAADSTIEPGNVTTKYVSGSGVVHECRDFDGLMAWMEKQELVPQDLTVA